MKKIYAALIVFLFAFVSLATPLSFLFWIWLIAGVAILVFGKETGPDSWAWSWTLKNKT